MLESSDVKGGSTSTVLTYLCRLLDSIDQPQLVHRTLRFLLATPVDPDPVIEISENAHKKHLSVSRRKSLDMLATLADSEEQRLSPSLFNLADLILMSIKSQNKETVVATLRLLTVIVRKHHHFAESLIKTKNPISKPQRAVGAFNEELRAYLSFATTIMDGSSLDESFDQYSQDATLLLESRLFVSSPRSSSILDQPADQPLDVCLDDAIFKEVMRLLDSFFSNSVTVNLGLTEFVTNLASSNIISLNGWLLVDPVNYEYTSKSPAAMSPLSEGDKTGGVESDHSLGDPLQAIRASLAAARWSKEHEALIAKSFRRLSGHVEAWRQDIPDFDILVAARRNLLHDDDDDDASREPHSKTTSRAPSQHPRSHTVDGPLSPRGRPVDIGSFPEGPVSSTPASLPRSTLGSPLRVASTRQSPGPSISAQRPIAIEDIRKRLASSYRISGSANHLIPVQQGNPSIAAVEDRTETATEDTEESFSTSTSTENETVVTLGHILTNVVILYEFILELTAMVQVRATLFEEAGFGDFS